MQHQGVTIKVQCPLGAPLELHVRDEALCGAPLEEIGEIVRRCRVELGSTGEAMGKIGEVVNVMQRRG